MEEKKALGVISGLSYGNERMKSLLELVYFEGKEVVDQWPETAVEKLGFRSVRAVGCLIHRRIDFSRLVIKGERYWESREGKRVNQALGDFIERRREKNR